MHRPTSIHLSFAFGLVKSWFVSKRITRTDPRSVASFLSNDETLNLRTTLVILVFYILNKKARNKFNLFTTSNKHFCIHCVYVVKYIKDFAKIEFSTAPFNAMQLIKARCCLIISFVDFGRQIENPCILPSIKGTVLFFCFSFNYN